MISARAAALALSTLVVLAGCNRADPRAAKPRDDPHEVTKESAYHPAPRVDGIDHEAGRAVLSGRAQPDAPVRLATPDGHVVTIKASATGHWRIGLPPSMDMRLFSLSMIDGGRIAQSEGYLAVAPDVAAQLRAGAGATVFGPPDPRPTVTAVDYDSKGGCVVSGLASPGRVLTIGIDGARRGGVRADALGRFSLALNEPIAAGSHTIELIDGAERSTVSIDVTPAGPMPAIPLRAVRTALGWRVDWTTPGGGLQTTLLFPAPRGPA